MIIGNKDSLMAQFEMVYVWGYDNKIFILGTFNFIINGRLYPGKGHDVELGLVLDSLKDDLKTKLPYITEDFTVQIHNQNLSKYLKERDYEVSNNLLNLSGGTTLYDHGFSCYLGFEKDEDRFFFTNDYAKTYEEVRFPKGTVEKLINSLPSFDELNVLVRKMAEPDVYRMYTKVKIAMNRKLRNPSLRKKS